MEIVRNTLETGAGPADWFTGSVYIDTIADADGDAPVLASTVELTGASTDRPLVYGDVGHVRSPPD